MKCMQGSFSTPHAEAQSAHTGGGGVQGGFPRVPRAAAAAEAPRLQPPQDGQLRLGHAAGVRRPDGVHEGDAEVSRDGALEHLLRKLPTPRLGARRDECEACCALRRFALLTHRQEQLHHGSVVHVCTRTSVDGGNTLGTSDFDHAVSNTAGCAV